MPIISIIIPTYNESKNIPILIERLDSVLATIDKEVIVVDDNSPDKTWEVVKNLSTKHSWLKSIRRMHDRGLSSAVLAGFAVAEGDYLVVMDADLQHDESILPKFLEAFQTGSDIVIGSRKVEGGSVENWSPVRKFVSYVATLMAKIALRYPVTDPMSGFFGITSKLYEQLKDSINPRGFKILIEFIAYAKKSKITELGYTFRGRIHGESKLTSGVIFDYLFALYDLSVGKLIPLRFVKYAVVGLSGLIISNLFLVIALNFIHLPVSSAINWSIELSIITNFILNNMWTFKNVQLRGFLPLTRGILTFHAICLGGALINQALTMKLNTSFHMNVYLANAVGYVIAAIWNYMINVEVTWKNSTK